MGLERSGSNSSTGESKAAGIRKIADRLLASGVFSDEAWAPAIRANRFEEAAQQIEQALTSNPADPKTRLWWVRCHLETGKLPLSALCSPLDEMFAAVAADASILPLATGVYARAAAGLAEKNQFRLAVATMGHAVELSAKSTAVQPGDLRQMREHLRTIITEERSRAESRRENKNYLKALDEKLARVIDDLSKTQAAQPAPAEPPKKSKAAARKLLSAKAILAEANRAAEADGSAESGQPEWNLSSCSASADQAGTDQGAAGQSGSAITGDSGAAIGAPEFPGRPGQQPAALKKPRMRLSRRTQRRVTAILAILACWFILPALWNTAFPPLSPQSIAKMTVVQPAGFSPSQSLLPAIEVAQAMTSGKSGSPAGLDSVHNRIKNIAVTAHNQAAANGGDESARAKAEMDPEVDQAALHWKNGGNSNSDPASGSNPFQQQQDGIDTIQDSTPKDQLVDRSKIPVLDPNLIDTSRTESIGVGRGVTAAGEVLQGQGQGLTRSSDGRIYGPPMEIADLAKDAIRSQSNSGRGLDGSSVQPIEVQQYAKPATFRVITLTKVLTAPSVVSNQVENLPADSKVQVTARLGQWLEIRSVNGRVGYIYAQDAVESQR